MRTENKDEIIVVYPQGRIDSDNAQSFHEELKMSIGDCADKSVEINMENVDYISSAGLRVFLQLKKEGISFRITEVSINLYEIFSVTGFTEIFEVSKALRRISVDGCKILGKGFYGTVYRIDSDTIVKVYNSPDSIPMIKNEQLKARQAFLKGIPTAISFDLVKVDENYGAVFELLNARTFNDIIIEEPERTDEIIEIYVDFLKKVHATEMDHGSLPYSAGIYEAYLDTIREYLTDEQYSVLKEYFSEFPEDDHFVHGDFQLKNVMMTNGEPMLIDMDTLSAGHSIFDLAGLYVTYCSFREDEPDNSMIFFGISNETAEHIWDRVIKLYYGDRSDEELIAIQNRICLMAAIRFLYLIKISELKNNEFAEIRIRHNKEHIRDLLNRVDGLYFEDNR